jgi:hypothetical protein
MSGMRANETRSGSATALVLTAILGILLSPISPIEEIERHDNTRPSSAQQKNGKKIK